MRMLVEALLAVVALAAVNLAVYVASGGMDCQGDGCSTAAEVSGALFGPLVIVAVILLLAIVAKSVASGARGSGSGGT